MAELDLGSVVGPQGQQGIQGQTGPQGPAGPGVPTGGTDGQFLLKDGSTNYETKWGTVTGADLDVSGVDSTKISAALTSANQAIANVQDGLAIVATGNTHAAIPAGAFVYVKNHGTLADGLYTNTSGSTIAQDGTLSSSNLTADASGGLNVLNSKIEKLSLNYNSIGETKNGATVETSSNYTNAMIFGSFVFLHLRLSIPTITNETLVYQIINTLKPIGNIGYISAFGQWDRTVNGLFRIDSDGNIYADASASGKDLVLYVPYVKGE